MEALGPWVQDYLRLSNSDGSYIRYRATGELSDQAAVDMDILDTVKSKWCELRNREMESKYGQGSIGHY